MSALWAWVLMGVFAVAEVVLVITSWRAHERARATGETRTHGAWVEAVWVALPGLGVAALVWWSFTAQAAR